MFVGKRTLIVEKNVVTLYDTINTVDLMEIIKMKKQTLQKLIITAFSLLFLSVEGYSAGNVKVKETLNRAPVAVLTKTGVLV